MRFIAPGFLTLFILACSNDPILQDGDPDRSDLDFASMVKVGDIIVTNNKSGSGCAYLNIFNNAFTFFTYCHAMLVVEKDGELGFNTIEALGPGLGVKLMEDRHWFLDGFTAATMAVLRVQDEDGNSISPERISRVVARAREFLPTRYEEPPIDLDGDPLETGIYCSMLPYRAYLDATGIDLDGFFPFVVTPDELYSSSYTKVIYESAPVADEDDDDDWDDDYY